VKPELTFRRSLRLIGKRWWLLVLGGVVFAGLAYVVAGSKKPHYVVTTVLTLNDIQVTPKYGHPGFDVLASPQKFPDSWVTTDFQDPSAAQTASEVLGGHPSAAQILAGITPTGLTTTTVQLLYTGGSNPSEALDVLKRYTTALLNARAAREQGAIHEALVALQQVRPQTPKIVRNEGTLASQLQQLPGNFSSDFSSPKPPQPQKVAASGPPAIVLIIGGFLAGMAGGALLALVLGRFDKKVRRPDDIEVVGVPVVDIDSEVDPASVQLLRSELELAGIGTRLGVMAVTRATRGEGSSGLALALARTFAGVGTPTILVSADLRARKVRGEAGLSALLDGSAAVAPLVRLEPNLQWLPEGSSNALPETLFSAPRVERIVRDLREQAGVIVIDTPAVLEDSETLPLIACSDIVLLVVRPGMTRWNPFGSAVALIQRVAKRPLHICYDRATDMSSVPALGERPSAVVGRVHQAIEVPAGS
jgi:Mrp family chromosome partitioning ATPase